MRIFALAVALATCLAAPLAAQSADAVITGEVRANGAPLAGASVTVRNQATGYQQVRIADATGRYTAAQLPLGGPYTVTARRIGYRAATRDGFILRLGDRTPVSFSLETTPTDLTAILVTTTREQREAGRAERIGASTIITPREIQAIPAANRSFTDLAVLAPNTSYAGTGGVITSSFSIAGGRVTGTDLRTDGVQTKNTLWGAGFGRGPYSLSMEAVREYEVVTNVYDVTQGRQGSGAINVATKSGTNEVEGSVFAYGVNRSLTTTNFQGVSPFDRRLQWGGSLGGPIVHDKAHYFIAFDRQDLTEPYQSLDVSTPGNENLLAVNKDSVARFVDILTRKYGLPSGNFVGLFKRSSVLNTAFGRVDWNFNDRHRLTIRNQYSDWLNPNSLNDRATSLSESWGTAFSRENQAMASLKSTFGENVSNDLRIAYTYRSIQNRETTLIPRGWVSVASTLTNPDGSTRTGPNVTLQFGGMRTTPEWQQDNGIQLVNTTRIDRGNTTWLFGTDNSLNRLSMYVSIETMGRFSFPNLAALDALKPSEYYRLVPLGDPMPVSRQWAYDGGLFGQGEFRLSDRLTATAGLRWDVSAFLTPAARNQLAEQRLGIRTDTRVIDAGTIQPRAQLVWDVTGRGTDVFRVGGGLFTAQPHAMLQINNILNDGLRLAEVRVTGNLVPTPDFPSYRRDLSTVPGIPTGATQSPGYLNVLSPNFRVPRTWKGDLAYQRRFGDIASLGAAFQLSKTTNLYHYYDRNLRDPAFTLDNEQGRSVFVPAESIPVKSPQGAGAVTRLSWKDPAFSRVLELRGDAAADQHSMVLDGSLRLWRESFIQGSYTYSVSRDNSSYNCCIAVSASFTPVQSDPRDLSGSWGPSNTDFRHKFVMFGALPQMFGVQVSGRYVGISGTPFSALVAGDVNGDDPNNNNDLAMVFDPADPRNATVAAAMQTVLDNPNNVARDYLRENVGRIASRNGASNPFTGRVDLRIARAFQTTRGQQVEFTVDAFNFDNLLNRDWGAQWMVTGANQTLLSIAGFDPATRRYKYNVNKNFGQAIKQGDPYLVQLGLRYRF